MAKREKTAAKYQELGYDAYGNDIPLPSGPKSYMERHPTQAAYMEVLMDAFGKTPLGRIAMTAKGAYDKSRQVEYGAEPAASEPTADFWGDENMRQLYDLMPSPPQGNSAPIDYLPGMIANPIGSAYNAAMAYAPAVQHILKGLGFGGQAQANVTEVPINRPPPDFSQALGENLPPMPTRNPKLPWLR